MATTYGLGSVRVITLGRQLAKTHTQVRGLVGRDLSGYLLGEVKEERYKADPIYFMSDDNIFKGIASVSLTGANYKPVDQPNSVETVFAYLPTGQSGALERWKYSRYWDNPAYWATRDPALDQRQHTAVPVPAGCKLSDH